MPRRTVTIDAANAATNRPLTDATYSDELRLPEDELLSLFAGRDTWHFNGSPSLGYPPMQVADCGHGVTLVAPPYGSATCFPTSVGMAATWNRALIEQVGRALGRETRAKGCAMLLAPMVNLHRLPCGGRNYETFSEDPVLTGKMAAALIRGLQSEGTAACIKSFACNNQQHDQKKTSSDVDPRTLRELYLKVFAIAFEESKPWSVMTSYNPVNGEHPSDSHQLIEELLRTEMGYQGVVVSDWRAVQGDRAIQSGLDIEMPGPGKVLCATRLKHALDEGLISMIEIERRARRVLALHAKCAAARQPGSPVSAPELDTPRHRDLCRQVAEESITLLKNKNTVLPLRKNSLRRLAVIGPNAATARLGGGGSASVTPFYSVSPLEGIRSCAGEEVDIHYAQGCAMGNQRPSVPEAHFSRDAGKEEPGLRAEYFEVETFDADGEPARTQVDSAVDFSWGWAAPATGLPRELYAVRWTGHLHLPASGTYTFALSTQEGLGRVSFGQTTVLDAWTDYDPTNFEAAYTNRHDEFRYTADAPECIPVTIEYRKTGTRGGIHLGWKPPFRHDPIEEAVELAHHADAAIIVAGLCNVYEGGAYDRRHFELPGRQVELIRAVAAANPNTIVVLKNGTPVDFRSWLDAVPAVLEAYYPGQEGGNALARVLFGEVNPSGKLPDSLPNSWEEVPAMQNYPGKLGHAPYSEGLMVGYRHYDASGTTPVFPFGYGLSYTTFEFSSPQLAQNTLSAHGSIQVTVVLRNTGERDGAETVQFYLEWKQPGAHRPPRALVGFEKVFLKARAEKTVHFTLHHKDCLSYDPIEKVWTVEGVDFHICVGPDSRQLKKAAFVVGTPQARPPRVASCKRSQRHSEKNRH